MTSHLPASRDGLAVGLSLLVLRLIVGVIFAAHGSQKLFGAFGGPGLVAMMKAPPEGMGLLLGILVTIGEFLSGRGLVIGFLCRFSAAWLIVIMIGAIAKVHGQNGFFLASGPDSALALIGLLAPILIALWRHD